MSVVKEFTFVLDNLVEAPARIWGPFPTNDKLSHLIRKIYNLRILRPSQGGSVSAQDMGRLETAQRDVAKAKRLEAIRRLSQEALPSPQPINDTAPNGKSFLGPIKDAFGDLKTRSDGNVAKSKDLEAVRDGISMTINQLEEAKGKSDAAIQAY